MGYKWHELNKTLFGVFTLTASLCVFSCLAEPGAFYRYVNDEGVTEIGKNIPPKYVQNGYEILNKNYQTIEVVPPAPSGEEIALQQTQREILQHYDLLRKRYSDVSSIESARKRRLDNLETSISILNGNISTLHQNLKTQMNQAATREREGKVVPTHILDSIANNKAEIAVAEELLEIRLKEKSETNKKFDKDIEYFVKGEALIEKDPGLITLPN